MEWLLSNCYEWAKNTINGCEKLKPRYEILVEMRYFKEMSYEKYL